MDTHDQIRPRGRRCRGRKSACAERVLYQDAEDKESICPCPVMFTGTTAAKVNHRKSQLCYEQDLPYSNENFSGRNEAASRPSIDNQNVKQCMLLKPWMIKVRMDYHS